MQERRIGVGIIGLGMAVQPHVEALRELGDRVRFLGGFSPSEERRAEFGQRFGLPTVRTEAALLDDPAVEVVFVLTPPRTHGEVARRACAAGKHVLLEKPVDVDLPRATALVEAFEQSGRGLGIVLQHRFREAPLRLAGLLHEQALGRLVSIATSIRWWRSAQYYAEPGRGMRARDGGGVLLTQAIHTLDLLLHLAGPVDTVVARCGSSGMRRIDTEDVACAVVTWPNGARGVIDATTTAWPGYPERIEIAGTEGTAVLEGDRLEVRRPDRPDIDLVGGSGGGGGADPMAFSCAAHRRLIAEFLDAVQGGRAPGNSGRSALPVHALIDAMLASDGATVKLPETG